MRVKVRNVLDTNKPINLRRLSAKDKIVAGIITQWKSTNIYKNNSQRKKETEYVQQLKRDEDLKNFLLAIMYRELIQNKTLSQKDKLCESIIIEVSQQYEDSLQRLFPNLFNKNGEPNKDFLSYEVTRVEENSDIRRALKDMPIRLQCSKKHL